MPARVLVKILVGGAGVVAGYSRHEHAVVHNGIFREHRWQGGSQLRPGTTRDHVYARLQGLDFITAETAAALEVVNKAYKDYSWSGSVACSYQSGLEIVPLTELRATLERETCCESELLKMDDWAT
ncbi:uncharacterized protein LY79DRAFT_576887 [Colletotrichum navitas]|uniref:Uncharacterized protein n=1 Tax=Colletotrichum navitas TaxID=681940 RepID=A0AAD8Q790_9PEZI|nr:uncharacterized protein LY79DRAFT_576887 [Colletotrichum navitas]KAK1597150.1 hypothetical protein LY79DRAFT_576887 [Colletotrichum navitas]